MFEVGDVFTCPKSYGFDSDVSKDGLGRTTQFFPYNSLKYMEIVDKRKFNKKFIYKIRLFCEKGKTDTKYYTWSFSNMKDPDELIKWVPKRVLDHKIYVGSIVKIGWDVIAKEQLNEGA